MSNHKRLLETLHDHRLALPPIGDPQRAAKQLEAFLREWGRWNDKINLTSETGVGAIIEKHIFDSLQYARVVKGPQIHVMDVGSGSGFPGIPLKVVFPGLFMVLVESQRKRASFLRSVVRELGMKGVEVLNQRAEELGADYRDRYDLVLFRGVGRISHCLQLGGPLLKIGGQVAVKKDPDEELPGSLEFASGNFQLREEISIQGYSGMISKLMRFERCFT